MSLVPFFTSLLVEIFLLCHQTGAKITWTKPLPIRGPLEVADISTRTTHQQILNGSSEGRLMWNFILSGETLQEVSYKIGSTTIGKKNSAGVITIQPISNFRRHFNISASDPATLIIYNVVEDDEAEFTCDVETDVRNWVDKIQVFITVLPKLTNVSRDQTVDEHTNLQLFCEASGKPTPNITWARVLEDGSYSEVLHRGPTWNYLNITRANAGRYRCTADNGLGNPVNYTASVFVRFSPRITLEEKHYADRGGIAYLYCRIEAYPPPTITWVPCNRQESVCDSSFLNISDVRTPKANYSCTAANEKGQASGSTTLVIGGKDVYISVTITTDEKCTEGASWREQIIEEMNKIFANRNGYSKAKVLNCRVGSVIVDLGLTFGVPVAEDFVISTIQSAIQNGKLGKLSVNASSIIGILPVITSTAAPPTSTTTPKSDDNKTLIIVLSVIGGVLFFVLIAVVVACCIRMKNKKDSREVDDHKGRKDGGQPSGPPPGAPGQNNTDYEEPGYASTSSAARTKKDGKDGKKSSKKKDAQQEEMPMYAQIDKSKKKPKPNSYSEVERPDRREPEIQYAVMDHSHPGGSMPRGAATQPRRAPETVYADLV